MRLDQERALLDRLYGRLTEALQQRPDPFGSPVTVAELYQELVPYRTVRGELGLDMNADYEHTLLRLLAGEGDWARLEPESARDAILKELRSSNPNVSIYREYAACDVWITPPSLGAPVPAPAGEPEEEDWSASLAALGVDLDDDAAADVAVGYELLELTEEDEVEAEPEPLPMLDEPPAAARASEPAAPEPAAPEVDTRTAASVGSDVVAETHRAPEPPVEAASLQAPPNPPSPPSPVRTGEPAAAAVHASAAAEAAARYAATQQAAAAARETTTSCVFCDSRLPAGRKARFCPFCGGDQTMRPCPTCGEALEAGWIFCIACGAPAAEDA